jgi:translation initiation factor 3 subunit B
MHPPFLHFVRAVGSSAGPEGSIRWPLFKWAGGQEDKYFARLAKGAIKVYEAPDMTLLDKKDLKMEGVLVSTCLIWLVCLVFMVEEGGGGRCKQGV